jgi:tetratricopeptide (TPR) repeat protein
MTRKIKLMLAFLAILALALTSCAKLQARDNLNKGVRAFTDAHYENAVNYFKQAMQLDPDLTVAEVYLGTAYSQMFIPNAQSEENQKNAEMAIATFQNVLKKDPNNTNAIAGLAYLYQNTGDLQKAHDYYMKNAELDSTNAVPFYAVGSVDWIMVYNKNNPLPEEEQAKLVEEGLSYLDKALAKNPEYEDAMSYKNLLYREKARLSKDEKEKAALIAQADEWFNKALETRKKLQEQKKAGGGVATTSDSK